jgi:2-keto-4-pentenoate hydratase/2-oxohepta-3-ene-1,7-dioic acid hydratase in catechol pathway
VCLCGGPAGQSGGLVSPTWELASSCLWGVRTGNDVSAREFQQDPNGSH